MPLIPTSVKCAIFDLDGLLLDTEPIYDVTFQEFAKLHGKSLKKLAEEVRPKTYGTGSDAARIFVEGLGLKATPEEFLAWRTPKLRKQLAQAKAMPDARELIESLHNRHIPIALATSSTRAEFDIKTKNHAWFKLFEGHIITGDNPAVKKRKPAPDIFLVAANQLHVHPKECLVFEDALNGVEAALAAGMSVVFVPTAHQPYPNFDQRVQIFQSLSDFLRDNYHTRGSNPRGN